MNVPMFKNEALDGQPKILIVDDNEGNVIAMQAVLGDLDIEILTATLAERAIYLSIVNDLALIIMDVHMPDMDGFETASRIRESERSKHVPIMFVTGVKRSPEEVSRGYNIGAVDYLLKPVDADILRAKVGAFLDIYGHRLDLERDHELLKAKNQKLREFAHIASHDLKAPLRQIAMCGQELAEEFETDDSNSSNMARNHVVYICSAVTRLQSLISSLLNFATLDNIPITTTVVDLEELIAGILGDFRTEFDSAQATINVSSLPMIKANPIQLQEVFHNLIGNALKYRRPDTPLKINVSAELGEESRVDLSDDAAAEKLQKICTIEISDNGTGIREANYDKIFRPFERLVSYDSVEGSGLGLSIVSRIIERHHGTISVQSTVGEGSTFILKLPAEHS